MIVQKPLIFQATIYHTDDTPMQDWVWSCCSSCNVDRRPSTFRFSSTSCAQPTQRNWCKEGRKLLDTSGAASLAGSSSTVSANWKKDYLLTPLRLQDFYGFNILSEHIFQWCRLESGSKDMATMNDLMSAQWSWPAKDWNEAKATLHRSQSLPQVGESPHRCGESPHRC